MKTRWVPLLLVFLAVGCEKSTSSAPSKSEAAPSPKLIVEKERVEREQPLPPEVKIRLKRDGKENYSWELNGSDADQILKINEKMTKKLGEKGK